MRKDLSDSEKFLLSHVASFPDGCYQLKRTIAEEMGWTISKVQRILAMLKKRGLVAWTFDGRKNNIRLFNNEQADYTELNSLNQICTPCLSKSEQSEDIKVYPIEYTLEHSLEKPPKVPQRGISPKLEPKPKITLNMDTWEWENITEKDRELWRKAYPAVNFDIELAKAANWIKANPKKKKSQWGRFLMNWFSNCQNRGGTRGFTEDPNSWMAKVQQ